MYNSYGYGNPYQSDPITRAAKGGLLGLGIGALAGRPGTGAGIGALVGASGLGAQLPLVGPILLRQQS